MPVAETPEGYEFEGWDRPFDYVTENMTVAALFEKMPGSEPQPQPEPQPDDVLLIARMDASDAPSVPPAAAHADAALMALTKTSDDVFFALAVETVAYLDAIWRSRRRVKPGLMRAAFALDCGEAVHGILRPWLGRLPPIRRRVRRSDWRRVGKRLPGAK